MDLADWLRTLNLAQYEAAFREHSVTVDLLPNLTAEDLKDLGVAPVGHRRRLLDAIAALRSNSSQAPAENPNHAWGPPAVALAPAGERRPLSVMFCDIIDFTGLSSRLDPEDLSAVIRRYQACVATTVVRFGGFVARYVGDGVLSYFGWPEAHEADAEQAVGAALAVIDAIAHARDLNTFVRLRVGIATGLVVVGEPIGTGEARQQTAIGETPNLAARLQGLAEPNGVVIDATTRGQIGGLFICRDLGLVRLKGLPEPEHAWQVVEQAAVESRFEALHAGTMAPLIGRDEEIELLLRRWRQAKTGEGQLVLLCGEPGIGKSRLIAELEEQLGSEPRENLRYFGSPHHQESALYPIITRWQQDLRLAPNDTAREKLRKLEAALAPISTPPENIALIADVLSVPVDARYPTLDFSPQRKKEKIFDALLRAVANRARLQPVLMLFEDAHWVDASSLELLDKAIALLTDLPILLVVSYRPEFQPPWVGLPITSLISLRRLTRKQAAQLAERIVVERVLPPGLLNRIVTQTDGVPLFIEELTKAVMESSADTAPNEQTLGVPTTLRGSLLARLDRLPDAKQVAQIGSVIGREFSRALVACVAQMSDAQLARGFDELVESGLASRRGAGPNAVYTFKHSLVQDATYESLLRSRRAEIHATIVALAENGSFQGTEPGILAYHCVQAGLIAQAASYYRMAGERSVARIVAEETRGQLERGLRLVGQLPHGPERYRLEAELLIALGRILLPTLGQTHPETRRVLERAVDVCRQIDDARMLARSLYALGIVAEVSDDVRTAEAIGAEFLALGTSTGDIGIAIAAHARLGPALFYQGRFVAARDTLSEGLALCVPGAYVALDVAVSSAPDLPLRAFLAPTSAYLGFADHAVACAEQAIERARQLGPTALAFALQHAIRTSVFLRDEAWCRVVAEMQMAIAEEQRLPYFLANARCALGWVRAQQGDVFDGLNMLTEGVATLEALGPTVLTSLVKCLISDAFVWAERRCDAMRALDDALTLSAATGAAWLDSELHRRKAELLISKDRYLTAAETEFREAVDIARRQSAKLFELRAGSGLARLLCALGRRAEANALLVPIYSWFTEEVDLPDLADARTLLSELASQA